VGNFYKDGDPSRFYEVCRQHTHVIPTESAARAKSLEKEIEHRKQLEDALRVALRNRTKAEEELRDSLRREQQARAEAEGAATFRELFLGIVGHDLRNPLNTILNTARVMALRHDVGADGRPRLDRILASGVRMQRMIEQILDLTRARLAGGIPVVRTWQDVDPIVTKILQEARAAQPGREIRYERRGDCSASVDADRYEQVVSNLIQNALTHGAEDQPVQVTLTCSASAIHLAVNNFGGVMDPALVPYLFDPFKRTDKVRGRSDGLGLGLYIVDCIARAHQGMVSVSSSEDTGTTFEVTMPRHERDLA
jgi:signal transduction histidine kinase